MYPGAVKPMCWTASGSKNSTVLAYSTARSGLISRFASCALQRLRDNFGVNNTQAIHHLQKALFEMNVQLSNVISDVTGETSLRIIEAILAGERNPEQLAALCSSRIKAPRATVAKSLHRNWDSALLHCLKTALDTYRFTQRQIQECALCIQRQLAQFDSRAPLPESATSLKAQLHRVCGVDLTKIPALKNKPPRSSSPRLP